MTLSIRFTRRLAAALLASACATLPAWALDVGVPAPAFSLPSKDGATVSIEDYRGKVVYLDFWASWCGPCRQTFPWMNKMQQQFGEQGFAVVAVNVDKKQADADAFLQKIPASFTVLYDPKGKIPTQYEIMGMPSSVLIGRDGKVIAQHTSFRESEAAGLEAQIRDAVAAKP
jgi:peroxiredoxin